MKAERREGHRLAWVTSKFLDSAGGLHGCDTICLVRVSDGVVVSAWDATPTTALDYLLTRDEPGEWWNSGMEDSLESFGDEVTGRELSERVFRYLRGVDYRLASRAIEKLRDEAAAHGDHDMVKVCKRALEGDGEAVTDCLRAIDEAKQAAEDDR